MKAQHVIPAVLSVVFAAGALAQNQPKNPPAIKPFKIQDQRKVIKQTEAEKEKAAEEARKAAESDPAMKKMIEAGEPGEHHKHMAALVGTWIGSMKMWDAPGSTPQESETRATIRMDMDGRYLRATHEGDFAGMPFRGQSVWGYNNLQKRYESTWIDNFSTGIMFATGSCDSDGKVFTFKGEADDPMTGSKYSQREVTTVVSGDRWKLEMYKPGPDGKEFKAMEINFKSIGASPVQAQRRAGRAQPKPDEEKTQPASPK